MKIFPGVFLFIFFLYFNPVFGKKKASLSHCLLVSKIIGIKDFYIVVDKKLAPKSIKKGQCIPLNSSFELPKNSSLKLTFKRRVFFFINGGSHIRISKFKKALQLRVSTGVFRIYLKPSSEMQQGLYIETTDMAAFLKGPKRKDKGVYDYIFERTPWRTSLYSLRGFAFVAENINRIEKKTYDSKLQSKEYTYGSLSNQLSFKKIRNLRNPKRFLNRFYKKNPYLKKQFR